MDATQSMRQLLNSSPIDLLEPRAICYAWELGFDQTQAIQIGGGLFLLTISFFNPRQQYVLMLSIIVQKGLVLNHTQ